MGKPVVGWEVGKDTEGLLVGFEIDGAKVGRDTLQIQKLISVCFELIKTQCIF